MVNMKKKPTYELVLQDGQYQILVDGKDPIMTPHGTVFMTPYMPIVKHVLKDLKTLGPDSYTSGFSSLCYAFSYDNMMNDKSLNEVRKALSEIEYEEDYYFQPAFSGLPPARVLWNHVFLDENRGEDVRKWLKRLSPLQLMTAFVIFQTTENMNMAFLFGKIIEEGNDGILIDLKNLYNNLLSSNFDERHIERLFQLFKLFYTVEKTTREKNHEVN